MDFDQDFPFDKEPETDEDKQKYIFNIIKECYENPQKLFNNTLPKSYVDSLYKCISQINL